MNHAEVTHVWPSALPVSAEHAVSALPPEVESLDGATEPVGGLHDAVLVRASVNGDRHAFDEIVTRHRRTVYRVCVRYAGTHEDASDLVQEVFVRAWRGLRTFKGQSQFSTWLYRVAVNVCLNRASLRRLDVEPLESDRFEDPNAADPHQDLVRAERATAVRRAVATLPKKQRATLILRAYHDLSHQEIADILGSSVGAVKANFFHALANLKRALGNPP